MMDRGYIMARKKIPHDEMMTLLECDYISGVTESNIYFTAEFKEAYYQRYLEGKSFSKILKELGVPLTPTIIERRRGISDSIVHLGKTRKSFIRKNELLRTTATKTDDDIAKENVLLKQQLEFLKKITEATKPGK